MRTTRRRVTLAAVFLAALSGTGSLLAGCPAKPDPTFDAAPPPGPNARAAPKVNDPSLSVGPVGPGGGGGVPPAAPKPAAPTSN